MPRAVVNPEEVRRFAGFLEETAGQLRAGKNALSGSFEQLHEVWRDEKYTDFDRTFGETMAQLDLFLREADNYTAFLRKKAQKAQRYLDL